MRNDEVGFQVGSRRLTTEDTEITEGKSDGGHFPRMLQAGGSFTHRQGQPSEQFLSLGAGFLSERLWARRCGFGGWMARPAWEEKEGFRAEMWWEKQGGRRLRVRRIHLEPSLCGQHLQGREA
jgi:hypothetical protein